MEQRGSSDAAWGGAGGARPAAAPDNGTAAAEAAAERDRVRVEFYATYDVMTGVRIAATLGGFFALMVFLIVYKSRSKSVKAMNDPKLVELAEAVVAEEEAVEEERALNAVLEEALAARGSLGGSRFLRSPCSLPRRPSVCGDSLPASVLRGDRRWSGVAGRRWSGVSGGSGRRWSGLSVPASRDRRLSSVTFSSSGSGYLERRPSSVVCTLEKRQLGIALAARSRLQPAPAAPLASACASLAVECELVSVGADSVFAEDDTDGEVDQFSTDSGGAEATELSARPRSHSQRPLNSRETLF